jgi:Polyketide cyclase / dehydrase and lipid transport
VPTVRVVAETSLPPDRVLEAAHDFSARREQVWPAVSVKRLEVHELGDMSADVTEGTRAGPVVNWERCRYDWSQPGVVTAPVTDSNVYDPAGSSWEIRATAREDGGSKVEMAWIRQFKSGPRGSFFGFFFGRIGERIFGKYASDVLKNLEKLDADAQ